MSLKKMFDKIRAEYVDGKEGDKHLGIADS